MTNPSNNNRDGISRYSDVIYDPSKTHGSNFFLMLANTLAKYQDERNGEDNSENQDDENVLEQNSYTTEGSDEGTKEVERDRHDCGKYWRKCLKFIDSKIRKRSNAIARKYIKRGKSYAMQHKYVGKINRRHKCDYFVFNLTNAKKTSKTGGGGDRRPALLEREWFAAQYAKRFGKAPKMVDDEVVIESLMRKTKCRYVGSKKHFPKKVGIYCRK